MQPKPVQSRASIESHAEMDTSTIISPYGKVKAETTQQKIVTVEKEFKLGFCVSVLGGGVLRSERGEG